MQFNLPKAALASFFLRFILAIVFSLPILMVCPKYTYSSTSPKTHIVYCYVPFCIADHLGLREIYFRATFFDRTFSCFNISFNSWTSLLMKMIPSANRRCFKWVLLMLMSLVSQDSDVNMCSNIKVNSLGDIVSPWRSSLNLDHVCCHVFIYFDMKVACRKTHVLIESNAL